MTRTIRITRFVLSARFRTEFHAAPENVRTAAEKALRLLEQNPGAVIAAAYAQRNGQADCMENRRVVQSFMANCL